MSEVKDPIAQRTLKAGDSAIVVTIGKPEEDEGDYRCWYSLDTGQNRKQSYAIGADSLQALQLAMIKINADLLALGEELGVPVTWLDDTPGGGFVA
ncbi:hypothetical protein GCM10007164_23640 [Luteimonas padinae]|uniref:DUF6968 family protein n=1 Tax=Luteimonas padinae TaxID=1714359 RepID=A0ABV6SUS6_9GAMM|nr:hypothetical protein GCM10007164_23640 [Luteimonas padinae]